MRRGAADDAQVRLNRAGDQVAVVVAGPERTSSIGGVIPTEEVPTEAELIAAESAVWEALRAGDQDADRALLAPEFLGVYPTGFIGREDHVAELDDGPIVIDYEIETTRHLPVGADSALIAYRVVFRSREGHEPVTWMVSSLWRREPDGALVNTFSQDTPVPADPSGAAGTVSVP